MTGKPGIYIMWSKLFIWIVDPFGNYLCQKMLEKCNNDQRTAIIRTVAPELSHIALNMHGTRAVQRLIEYLSTQEQVGNIAT
jgi:hypothetical protein